MKLDTNGIIITGACMNSISLSQYRVPINKALLRSIVDTDGDDRVKRKTKRHGSKSCDLDLAIRYNR